ncbi:hypothetical protein CCMA1212_008264 [Trichoderma ghanense]|uniref:Uncharacterized protein n=1 Tax=Trichoderma ghanense TaxID=65468 RepID=A0ABY2GWA2_9HYPO
MVASRHAPSDRTRNTPLSLLEMARKKTKNGVGRKQEARTANNAAAAAKTRVFVLWRGAAAPVTTGGLSFAVDVPVGDSVSVSVSVVVGVDVVVDGGADEVVDVEAGARPSSLDEDGRGYAVRAGVQVIVVTGPPDDEHPLAYFEGPPDAAPAHGSEADPDSVSVTDVATVTVPPSAEPS